jgi:hypothetical protein
MNKFRGQGRTLVLAFLLISCASTAYPQNIGTPPRVFLLHSSDLQQQKRLVLLPQARDRYKPALARLERDADKALNAGVDSIVSKSATPPSGDKHDYMSQAPYFWRNPNTPTGFPYVRRDGERNPEIKQFPDSDLLDKMVGTVETLAIAYYFTNRQAYAEKAAAILRMWFLDPRTRMNPNLEFGQAIPGVNTGRGIGLIETRSLPRVVDAIGMLEGAKDWTKADQAGLEAWFANFLTWMTTSAKGRAEAKEKNNHGTYYDVQVVSYALFTGEKELAKSVLESAKETRIRAQIEPDGRQPLELARTKSWSYSNMNLAGLISLAELGDSAGVDLWSYQTRDGRSLRRAIEFLDPYARDPKSWTFTQIEPISSNGFYSSLRRAARRFPDAAYAKMIAAAPSPSPTDRDRLLGY